MVMNALTLSGKKGTEEAHEIVEGLRAVTQAATLNPEIVVK